MWSLDILTSQQFDYTHIPIISVSLSEGVDTFLSSPFTIDCWTYVSFLWRNQWKMDQFYNRILSWWLKSYVNWSDFYID